MLSFMTGDSRGYIIMGFGLSEANVQFLRMGKPILFPLRRLQVPMKDSTLLITYDVDPGSLKSPYNKGSFIVVSFDDADLDKIKRSLLVLPLEHKPTGTKGEFLFFYGKTEADMEDMLRQAGYLDDTNIRRIAPFVEDGAHKHSGGGT